LQRYSKIFSGSMLAVDLTAVTPSIKLLFVMSEPGLFSKHLLFYQQKISSEQFHSST
jgi:hypothetical protein